MMHFNTENYFKLFLSLVWIFLYLLKVIQLGLVVSRVIPVILPSIEQKSYTRDWPKSQRLTISLSEQ